MLGRLLTVGRTLKQGLLHLLYPGACWVCGQSIAPTQVHFCDLCRKALLTDPFPTCPRCAGTVGPYAHVAPGCPACRNEHFAFERVLRLGPYEGPLREVILRLKNQAGEGLADLLGSLWAEYAEAQLRSLAADVVLPVPLHWWRRWTRGYNQSEALARALAARLHLPCQPRWLRRTRATPQQTRQTPAARKTNVKGAFQATSRSGLRGKTVLLVDDVMTTGSTAGEAARALRQAGAARVVVAVLARATG